MSGDLDIRGGGAVAVDTATLRAAADGFSALAAELEEIAARVGSAALRLFAVSDTAWAVSNSLEVIRRRILAVADDAHALTGALRGSAAVYEVAELRAERALAEAGGDSGALARIDARIAALGREYPEADLQATLGILGHWVAWPGGLAEQAPGALWWLVPGFHAMAIPAAWAMQHVVGTVGAGTVRATARLQGRASAVVLTPIALHGPATAPTSLSGAVARIPRNGDARIRVERYTMPDGSRQFAVYVAGTQTAGPHTEEPFDMGSNLELYAGERSASYDAALAALRDAGAGSGDVVHAFGHSQGAMVAGHVALEGGFDTRTLVSFGSPIEADIGDRTLSVSLRHSDDPVAALAGGGSAGAVGAPGSFIASRTADPASGLHDFQLPAHGIEEYARTAMLLDDSGDARMEAVRELFDQLGAAASVEITEYAAQRVVAAPEPRPGPEPTPAVSPYSGGGG